ncbi:MAG: hypothetical protein KAS32_24250 [Candidatus Peribacteraceae bacterium]|nr:hypothetical protein [Candidatus Peribacteraceae bacterium]
MEPSYTDIHDAVEILADHIDFSIDMILGISRGGLLPATIMSHLMAKPMIPVSYSSSKGKGDNYRFNRLPIVGVGVKRPTLLIMDDICDTGHTLKEITSHYKGIGHKVHTMTLYHKIRDEQIFIPDRYVWELQEDSPWVIFPWEN